VPPAELDRGRIAVAVKRDGGDIVIDVFDNGIGLPKDNRNRLLEPYVTTREKGTGLGLAIVGRILEDHGGHIDLDDLPAGRFGGRGAWARLRFAAAHVTENVQPVPEVRKVAARGKTTMAPTFSSSTTKPISAIWWRYSRRRRRARTRSDSDDARRDERGARAGASRHRAAGQPPDGLQLLAAVRRSIRSCRW
jgi:hypothetical protein